MAQPELVEIFVCRLEAAGIRYAVTGSVASMLYGQPRLTDDVDLVVELACDQASRLAEAFPLEAFYCPPTEALVVEAQRALRGHFNLIHHDTGYRADVYLAGKDPLQRWALDAARKVELQGIALRLAPPEYVILRKLEYFREGGSDKHLADIRGMLAVAGNELDRPRLEELIEQAGVTAEWRKVQR